VFAALEVPYLPDVKTAPYGADTGKKPSKSIPLETRRALEDKRNSA
jgi:hypothetical protein